MKKYLIPLLTFSAIVSLPLISQADGEEMYLKNCKKCHGETGKGDTAMGAKFNVRDYTKADIQASLTDEQIATAIKNGLADEKGKKVMLAFDKKLSDEEVSQIVTYFRTLQAE